MFYRETGQFKSRYKDELAAFPLFEDKIGIFILGILSFVVINHRFYYVIHCK